MKFKVQIPTFFNGSELCTNRLMRTAEEAKNDAAEMIMNQLFSQSVFDTSEAYQNRLNSILNMQPSNMNLYHGAQITNQPIRPINPSTGLIDSQIPISASVITSQMNQIPNITNERLICDYMPNLVQTGTQPLLINNSSKFHNHFENL
jgi:hypothetical protein